MKLQNSKLLYLVWILWLIVWANSTTSNFLFIMSQSTDNFSSFFYDLMKIIVSKLLTIVAEIEEDKIRAHLVPHMMWSIFHNENNKTNRFQLQICNDDLIFKNRIFTFFLFFSEIF